MLCLFLPPALILESINLSPLLIDDMERPSASTFMILLFVFDIGAWAFVTVVIQLFGCVGCSADFLLSILSYRSVLIVIFFEGLTFFWPVWTDWLPERLAVMPTAAPVLYFLASLLFLLWRVKFCYLAWVKVRLLLTSRWRPDLSVPCLFTLTAVVGLCCFATLPDYIPYFAMLPVSIVTLLLEKFCWNLFGKKCCC